MLLHEKVIERVGPEGGQAGSRVTRLPEHADGTMSAFIGEVDGSTSEAPGTLLIGAYGIHSAVRAQMHPAQPPIHWAAR